MKNSERLQQFFDLTFAGDLDKAVKLVGPDLVTDEPASLPYGGQRHGSTAFFDTMTAVKNESEFSVVSMKLTDCPDGRVLAEFEVTFTKSGQTIHSLMTELWSYTDDGLLSKIDIFYKDTAEIVAFFERTGRP